MTIGLDTQHQDIQQKDDRVKLDILVQKSMAVGLGYEVRDVTVATCCLYRTLTH